MKDGVSARDVYQHAVSYVKSNMPDLEKNFVKSVGFGVISFTDIIIPCTKIFLKDGH
jgi:nucleosome binding factor SPN SPT16 subunit